jgi:hypothetical protein
VQGDEEGLEDRPQYLDDLLEQLVVAGLDDERVEAQVGDERKQV